MENFLVKNIFSNRKDVISEDNGLMSDFVKWRMLIQHMNSIGSGHFSGTSLNCYYGVVDGDTKSCSSATYNEYYADNPSVKLVSVSEALDILNINDLEDDLEYVVLHTGSVVLLEDNVCQITSQDSDYHLSYAFVYDVVEVDIGSYGTALRSECSRLYGDGDLFVTDCKHENDIAWSEYNGQYICTHDDYSHYGYIDTYGNTGWFNDDEYIYCESYEGAGTYFANDRIAESFNVYYDDSQCEWIHRQGRGRGVSDSNANYHSSRLDRIHKEPNASWKIGFEIEKEDDDVGCIHYKQLYERTRWIKESDGSLNNDGYELISPSYDLFSNKIEEDMKDEDIEALINGDYSDERCGGHIHLSSINHNTEVLFEGVSGFFPLLYSLYEFRINENYCKARKKHDYYRKDKYSAVFIRDYTIEFRIFSAVKSVSNLLWRRDLIRIMVENFNKSEVDVLRMMVNQKSKLYFHLRKILSHEDIIKKIDLFLKYAEIYCNKKISKPIIRQSSSVNIEITNKLGA